MPRTAVAAEEKEPDAAEEDPDLASVSSTGLCPRLTISIRIFFKALSSKKILSRRITVKKKDHSSSHTHTNGKVPRELIIGFKYRVLCAFFGSPRQEESNCQCCPQGWFGRHSCGQDSASAEDCAWFVTMEDRGVQ